ncbi:hypothetical protein HMPREF2700_08825 [Neisseria sp. HMSC068C04]|nr:hypothetical protein HMPREF2700_08825 [Neisseria sp. HMSC068C04]
MFMPTAVAVNTNRQLEHAALLTAQVDKFYIMWVLHNLLAALLRVNLELSISMSLQNTELGQIIPKQAFQVVLLIWIHLKLPKEKLLKPVNEVVKINHANLGPGFEMAVSLSLKEKMVKNGEIFSV